MIISISQPQQTIPSNTSLDSNPYICGHQINNKQYKQKIIKIKVDANQKQIIHNKLYEQDLQDQMDVSVMIGLDDSMMANVIHQQPYEGIVANNTKDMVKMNNNKQINIENSKSINDIQQKQSKVQNKYNSQQQIKQIEYHKSGGYVNTFPQNIYENYQKVANPQYHSIYTKPYNNYNKRNNNSNNYYKAWKYNTNNNNSYDCYEQYRSFQNDRTNASDMQKQYYQNYRKGYNYNMRRHQINQYDRQSHSYQHHHNYRAHQRNNQSKWDHRNSRYNLYYRRDNMESIDIIDSIDSIDSRNIRDSRDNRDSGYNRDNKDSRDGRDSMQVQRDYRYIDKNNRQNYNRHNKYNKYNKYNRYNRDIRYRNKQQYYSQDQRYNNINRNKRNYKQYDDDGQYQHNSYRQYRQYNNNNTYTNQYNQSQQQYGYNDRQSDNHQSQNNNSSKVNNQYCNNRPKSDNNNTIINKQKQKINTQQIYHEQQCINIQDNANIFNTKSQKNIQKPQKIYKQQQQQILYRRQQEQNHVISNRRYFQMYRQQHQNINYNNRCQICPVFIRQRVSSQEYNQVNICSNYLKQNQQNQQNQQNRQVINNYKIRQQVQIINQYNDGIITAINNHKNNDSIMKSREDKKNNSIIKPKEDNNNSANIFQQINNINKQVYIEFQEKSIEIPILITQNEYLTQEIRQCHNLIDQNTQHDKQSQFIMLKDVQAMIKTNLDSIFMQAEPTNNVILNITNINKVLQYAYKQKQIKQIQQIQTDYAQNKVQKQKDQENLLKQIQQKNVVTYTIQSSQNKYEQVYNTDKQSKNIYNKQANDNITDMNVEQNNICVANQQQKIVQRVQQIQNDITKLQQLSNNENFKTNQMIIHDDKCSLQQLCNKNRQIFGEESSNLPKQLHIQKAIVAIQDQKLKDYESYKIQEVQKQIQNNQKIECQNKQLSHLIPQEYINLDPFFVKYQLNINPATFSGATNIEKRRNYDLNNSINRQIIKQVQKERRNAQMNQKSINKPYYINNQSIQKKQLQIKRIQQLKSIDKHISTQKVIQNGKICEKSKMKSKIFHLGSETLKQQNKSEQRQTICGKSPILKSLSNLKQEKLEKKIIFHKQNTQLHFPYYSPLKGQPNNIKEKEKAIRIKQKPILNTPIIYKLVIQIDSSDTSQFVIHSIIYKNEKIKTFGYVNNNNLTILNRKCKILNGAHLGQFQFCEGLGVQFIQLKMVSSKCKRCRNNCQGQISQFGQFQKLCPQCKQVVSVFVKKKHVTKTAD